VIHLAAGRATAQIDPEDGGRLAAFALDGVDILAAEITGIPQFGAGSFAMTPFAGRIRDGRFSFDGRDYELPINMGLHAIHGYGFDHPWQVESASSSPEDEVRLVCELGRPWPFAGRTRASFRLEPKRLVMGLTVEADEPMPASTGYHPWFRRRLDAPGSGELEIEVAPGRMYERDDVGMPTGRLVPPKPRPWDDCFLGMTGSPVLVWPGFGRITIESEADHWVIFDEHPDVICVEPQTGPPDVPNLEPVRTAEPGRPIRVSMIWRWQLEER
jgi:aldose 1-epimerase